MKTKKLKYLKLWENFSNENVEDDYYFDMSDVLGSDLYFVENDINAPVEEYGQRFKEIVHTLKIKGVIPKIGKLINLKEFGKIEVQHFFDLYTTLKTSEIASCLMQFKELPSVHKYLIVDSDTEETIYEGICGIKD